MDNITLYFRDGPSEKVYQASIHPKDHGFLVHFAYGRRGSTLNTGTKTPAPVMYKAARGFPGHFLGCLSATLVDSTSRHRKICRGVSLHAAQTNPKCSVSLILFERNKVPGAGNVTIPPNHDIPAPGTVVNCRYLYAFKESGSIYQPVFLGPVETSWERNAPRPSSSTRLGCSKLLESC